MSLPYSRIKVMRMKLFKLNKDQILSSLYNFILRSFHVATNCNIFIFSSRYKRDYYINDDEAYKNLHYEHSPSPTSTSTNSTTTNVTPISPALDVNNEDEIIKPSKKSYEEMTVSMLIGNMEMPLKYTRHDQDYSLTTLNSLPMSEDSETTRIYTPSTQETKLIAPHAERISTTKGFPVATSNITSDESEIGKIDDSSVKVSAYNPLSERGKMKMILKLLNFPFPYAS